MAEKSIKAEPETSHEILRHVKLFSRLHFKEIEASWATRSTNGATIMRNVWVPRWPFSPCSRWRRCGDIGLSFVIAHLFEIGDQSRPGRAPCQPFLGKRA